ncbi:MULTISPECIES: helix-turn-helix domain-containing protein [Bacillota]|jgi:transcriptional regulator with XRE-family HTH domain|uniref:helix-turn-helix domain-containing protein n=1 Tax=Bacillota TaxID=1239 RepID=UPI00089FB1BF|nr:MULTISPECIES: helix-turn-helix transcriptional regulator [Bacillota]MCR1935029.1 helix-turn-helix domain-containing protein [Clostridium tepidum]SCL81768.1 RapGH repressor [Sporanaerobacter sp. PP17-6a]STA93531.1 Helix-turn-helix [Clostridium cochlearium]HCW03958.1 XRE family transcriptional regulator [Clostridium sp.]
MKFGQKLRVLREEKGLSQAELAEKIGVSSKTISRYESGESNPRYPKIYDDIAEALKIDKLELLSDEDAFVLSIKEKFGSYDANYASDLVNGMVGLMAGGDISDDDKRVILETLQEAFIISKKENRKYIPKKFRLLDDEDKE